MIRILAIVTVISACACGGVERQSCYARAELDADAMVTERCIAPAEAAGRDCSVPREKCWSACPLRESIIEELSKRQAACS